MSNIKFMTPLQLRGVSVLILALIFSVLYVCRTGKCSSLHHSPITSPWPHRQNQSPSKSCRKKVLLPSRPSEPLSPRLELTPEVNRMSSCPPCLPVSPDLSGSPGGNMKVSPRVLRGRACCVGGLWHWTKLMNLSCLLKNDPFLFNLWDDSFAHSTDAPNLQKWQLSCLALAPKMWLVSMPR